MPFKDLCEGTRGCGMKVGSRVGSGGGISLQEASRCAVDGGGGLSSRHLALDTRSKDRGGW